MKYSVLVSRLSYGEITVEAENRKMVEEIALSEENRNKIDWFDSDQYKVSEISQIIIRCEKCGVELPDESVFCYKCGAKI